MTPTVRAAGIAGLGTVLGAGAIYGRSQLQGAQDGPPPVDGRPVTARSQSPDARMGLRGRGALPAHPWVDGNKVELLVDYPQAMPPLLRDIAAARHVVNVVMYIWKPDGPGKQLAELLIKKAQPDAHGRRVEVNVVVDERGTLDRSPKERREAEVMLDRMRAAGIEVRIHRPSGLLKTDIDHRKLFDVDNRVSYVGGMGMGQSYVDWHDAMLRIEGPAAAQAAAEFVGRWVDMGGAVSAPHAAQLKAATRNPAAAGAAQVRYVANSPGVRLAATDDLLTAARTAKKRLWVTTPNLSDDKAARALEAAARRGVDVHLIMAGPAADWKPRRKALSRTYYRDLLDAGVRVHEYPRMVHMKAWLADETLTLGSTNLSNAGLRRSSELSAAVRDTAVTRDFARMYRHDMAVSDEVTRDEAGGIDVRAHTLYRKLFRRQSNDHE